LAQRVVQETASTLYKGQSLLLTNQITDGLDYFKALPSDEQDVLKLGGTTLAYARLNQVSEAEAGIVALEAVLQTPLMERVMNFLILINSTLGRKERSIELIEQGMSFRLPMLVYLLTDPLLKPLQADVHFQSLVQQVLGTGINFENAKKKYKKTLFAPTELAQYKERLAQLMSTEKPYLHPDLSLCSLALQLDLSPNYLSRLLNEGFDKNFSEYVNAYRLEAFKTKLTNPANHHLTILGLAYDSGFNSKTVFNTFFKKVMGKTPKKYWKEVVG